MIECVIGVLSGALAMGVIDFARVHENDEYMNRLQKSYKKLKNDNVEKDKQIEELQYDNELKDRTIDELQEQVLILDKKVKTKKLKNKEDK